MRRYAHSLADAAAVAAAPVAERLAWLAQLAQTLSGLHARGVFHGGVKPTNVLVAAAGGGVFLADHGHELLRPAGADASLSGGGSAFCRDPEAAASGLSAASDVYALGAVGWLLLTGALPFQGVGVTEMAARVRAGVRPSLEALGAEAPAALAQLLQRCWAPRQCDRPTAAEFCAALGSQVAAANRPPPPRSLGSAADAPTASSAGGAERGCPGSVVPRRGGAPDVAATAPAAAAASKGMHPSPQPPPPLRSPTSTPPKRARPRAAEGRLRRSLQRGPRASDRPLPRLPPSRAPRRG